MRAMCNANLGWMKWFQWVDDGEILCFSCFAWEKDDAISTSVRSVIRVSLSPPLLTRGHTVKVRVHRFRHFCASRSSSMKAAVHPCSSASCKGTLPHAWHQQWQTYSPQKAKGRKVSIFWQGNLHLGFTWRLSFACMYVWPYRKALVLVCKLVVVWDFAGQDVNLLPRWMPMFAPLHA